jgi:flagellar hook assembly protein FlgD
VAEAPARTTLSAAMPTPFRDGTTFEYALARGGNATLAIFAVDGRRIRTLAGGAREAGVYRVGWDGRDDEGRTVAAGLYFARLTTQELKLTRTVMRVR